MGEGKKKKGKKKRLSDPINQIKVYTDYRQVAEMLTHTDWSCLKMVHETASPKTGGYWPFQTQKK